MLLAYRREQEQEQEDEGNLVKFLKKQGKDTPQNKNRFGEWMSRVGEPVAVLAIVHDEMHTQVISNVM